MKYLGYLASTNVHAIGHKYVNVKSGEPTRFSALISGPDMSELK